MERLMDKEKSRNPTPTLPKGEGVREE